MSEKQYFVVVDGQKLGPFDKRTITGMRVKKILTSDQQVFQQDGQMTTVNELIASVTNPGRYESSAVLSTGLMFPKFKARFLPPPADIYSEALFVGEVELRVQPDVLRISGKSRNGIWDKARESRIKVPREHIRRVKQTENLVAVQADALPDWPHKGLFSLEFAYAEEAKFFCEAIQTRDAGGSGPGILPDVQI